MYHATLADPLPLGPRSASSAEPGRCAERGRLVLDGVRAPPHALRMARRAGRLARAQTAENCASYTPVQKSTR